MAQVNQRVLPGFRLSLGFTMLYLTALVAVPLTACFVTTARLPLEKFWAAVWTPRAVAAYSLTASAAFLAACISAILGSLMAWALVRYDFPLKRYFDAMVDLPFALPTAVAGLVFSTLYVPSGLFGRFLTPLGIELAYSRGGIILVMVFIGFPFVVRTLQPILESLDLESEEASLMLGASRWQTFRHVIFPSILPGIVTGFALSFARALGEYGSVVFISSNIPGQSEIAAVLVVNKLEEFQYAEATAVATVLLTASFAMLAVINRLERWSRRWDS